MKISIIVPVYNVEKYLDRCIKSILNQTYEDLEIILVDDGSTDKSRMICNFYKQKDTRIKVIYQSNKGVSAARNAGIKEATGQYIGFVDSDDYIEPDMFDTLYNLICKFNCDIAICGYSCIYPRYVRQSDHLDRILIMNSEKLLEEIFTGTIKGFLCNKLFKIELFENISIPEDIHFGEDLYTVVNILNRYNDVKCIYTSRSLYNYVQVSSSITNNIIKCFTPDGRLKLEESLESVKKLYLKNEKITELINVSMSQLFLDAFKLLLLSTCGNSFPRERYLYIKRKLINSCSYYIRSKNVRARHKFLYLLAILSPRLFKAICKYKMNMTVK